MGDRPTTVDERHTVSRRASSARKPNANAEPVETMTDKEEILAATVDVIANGVGRIEADVGVVRGL